MYHVSKLPVERKENRNKENDNHVRLAQRAWCYRCERRKIIAGDIIIDGVAYPLCNSCYSNNGDMITRKCLKCDKEFMSVNGLRMCFKCKGMTKSDKVKGEKL